MKYNLDPIGSFVTKYRVAFAVAWLAVLLNGCFNKPEKTEKAGRDFEVETLFTKDGCTVYRFEDGGYARYFTNCRGSTEWQKSNGDKNGTTYPEGVSGGKS